MILIELGCFGRSYTYGRPELVFVFNFYRHWSSIFLLSGNGTASFLHSKEGMTKGYPLEMIVYGTGILPLINNIKQEIPNVTHPWYADDAGALGMFARLATYFYSLTRQGLGWGYYPKPPKIVLIVRPENIEAGKESGAHHGSKVCMGARYLGGYIGYD